MINFTIKGSLAGLNEFIAANRQHRIKGNKLKRRYSTSGRILHTYTTSSE